LIGWHHTDLKGNGRTGLYRLSDGRLTRANESFLPAVAARKFLFSLRPYRFLAEHSHLYCTTREIASEKAIDLIDWIQSVRKGERSARKAATAPASPGKHQAEEDLAVALLKRICEVGRAGGAEVIILDVPRTVREQDRRRLVSSLPAEAGELCTAYSPIQDLAPFPLERTFWQRSAGHWTPLGCQIVGKGLAKSALPVLEKLARNGRFAAAPTKGQPQ